ncbi:hypothetical protein MOD31_12720 [Paenarthrobacter sp. TYUT067]|uniref:beta-xylosidase family glycoside hydrolase n=1 Tax=Paenarthrobacter sp. TYUT067 TaxID=2926245 RepID=UPI00202DF42F|nr:hypothetical protein [Paenarthrobacter sp. TYUT067]MCM0616892.1 hypothetical protein [Paenarthrobacter sp. TYUT067]
MAVEYRDIDLPGDRVAAAPDGRVSWINGWRTLGSPEDLKVAADGSVTLSAGADLSDPKPLGTLLLPQNEYHQEFTATVVPTDGVAAGIAVWANSSHHYSALVRRESGQLILRFRKRVQDLTVQEEHVLDSDEEVRLTIEAEASVYRFFADAGGKRTVVGEGAASLLSAENIAWFTNVNFMLAVVGTDTNKGSAVFSNVARNPRETVPPRPFTIPR